MGAETDMFNIYCVIDHKQKCGDITSKQNAHRENLNV